LEGADELLKMGLAPAEITLGYELALEKAIEILPTLVVDEIKDIRSEAEVMKAVRPAIMSKQIGHEDTVAKLVTQACISILPETQTQFNVDNVRVCKILGSTLLQSSVVQGLMFKRSVESTIIKKSNAKIVVFTCPIDVTQTETKGTVLINTAKELMDFSQGEEALLENQIKAIAESGANVVVAGGKIGDLAMHFLNKYNIMAVRLLSKFDLRRVCKATNASAYPKIEQPKAEDLGFADEVYVDEVGDTSVIVFRIGEKESRISTIVLRGATDNFLDDIERAVNDGVNTFKALNKDGRLLAGAGAVEVELARQITSFGETLPGLEQYSVKKFASALESFITIFADNSGRKSKEILARLYAAHHEGKINTGFNILDESEDGLCDAKEEGIFDLFINKLWAIQYATNAANTILQVDQIIMAKRAGGPKARPAQAPDEDD
jgi:T-complex protein 1 subunit theta